MKKIVTLLTLALVVTGCDNFRGNGDRNQAMNSAKYSPTEGGNLDVSKMAGAENCPGGLFEVRAMNYYGGGAPTLFGEVKGFYVSGKYPEGVHPYEVLRFRPPSANLSGITLKSMGAHEISFFNDDVDVTEAFDSDKEEDVSPIIKFSAAPKSPSQAKSSTKFSYVNFYEGSKDKPEELSTSYAMVARTDDGEEAEVLNYEVCRNGVCGIFPFPSKVENEDIKHSAVMAATTSDASFTIAVAPAEETGSGMVFHRVVIESSEGDHGPKIFNFQGSDESLVIPMNGISEGEYYLATLRLQLMRDDQGVCWEGGVGTITKLKVSPPA